MTEEQARAIFLLAGISVSNAFQIENGYWPEAYVEARKASPWWLMKTERGLVRIGRRKRVISIDWSNTPVRLEVTEDDTTKGDTYVHAWTNGNAVDYLATWNRAARTTE